ncbi:MAG: GNAT family N-acetyltransferase [Planctomycetota bacterium]
MSQIDYRIRPAIEDEIPTVYEMIRELAVFEKLEHQLVGTAEDLASAVASDNGPEILVAEEDEQTLIGYALFFHNFSTFQCRRGLYLEDLYVRPVFRGRGVGTRLLLRLRELANERGCGRMEWAVLDWNQQAIDFYRSLGAEVLPDWRIVRFSKESMEHPSP